MAVLRLGALNAENLFGRAKVFNFEDQSLGDHILARIDVFQTLLLHDTYTPQDKDDILRMITGELQPYIEVREDRGKLFRTTNFAITGVLAKGRGDWDGTIVFKQAPFSEVARDNTARVIKEMNAHVACVVEAENRPALQAFDAHLLNSRYPYELLIDANDPRGIDVGLYSKYSFGTIHTHMFDRQDGKQVFSRDCLEVEVKLPGRSLYILCNHFKSRGYDPDGSADEKRTRQSTRVAEILGGYDLTRDWVVVAGDFNDNPGSPTLQPLLGVTNLFDVLALQFPNEQRKRWTYHYNKFEQIDFILVSKALRDRFRKAGVVRKGIYDLKNLTTATNGQYEVEEQYATVTHWTNAASDHAAVWAEFTI